MSFYDCLIRWVCQTSTATKWD